MSNEVDNLTEVVITKEDAKNIREFFSHFDITLPDFLSKQIQDITDNERISLEQQNILRVAIARAISESDHEIFKDQLFEEVIPNCDRVWFDHKFSEDFEVAMAEVASEEKGE